MSSINLSSVCRCCHINGGSVSFNTNDTTFGMKYSKILEETFNIQIYNHNNETSYSICEKCKFSLHKAYLFKKQVLLCEEKFQECCESKPTLEIDVMQIKCENECSIDESNTDDDFGKNKVNTEKHLIKSEGNHQCFRGKEHIYQDEEDSTILFVHNDENENEENHEGRVFNYEESEVHNSLTTGYTGYIESDEDLSQSADFKTESNPKKNAVWTKQATISMLSLYEANIQILTHYGKKSWVWKTISEGLKDLCIQVTADQVKWKFNRLYQKYKECIDNNSKSGRAHMTFEYYEQFEEIFHKEKNVSTPRKFSSSILTTNDKKRKHDITESNDICDSKKFKMNATSSEKNLPPVDESPELKTTPVADVEETAENQEYIKNMEILELDLEKERAKDAYMVKFIKMRQIEVELKKRAIAVREAGMQVKRDVASQKLKFNLKKHKDWVNIQKIKISLLGKLLRSRIQGEESD